MAKLQVERIGGLAGFGGAGAHIRSHGEVDLAALSPAERQAVDALFKTQRTAQPSEVRDGFRYRIGRTTSSGTETVEVPEAVVPTVISQCVKDELV